MSSQSKPVLVTGAGGFIGSHLVELLVARGYRVRAFLHYNSMNDWHHLDAVAPSVRDAIEVRMGDIADPYAVDNAVRGCRGVFHLAALIGIPYSYVAPASYISTNVQGTLNVVEAARRHDVERVVHTSTSETYGSAQYVPIDEAHPLVGQSPYSASKIGADKIAESFWLSFGLPVTILRPFNTYGPRQSMRAIIPSIVGQALTRDVIRLGNLDPVRDLTFVTDTAAGFLAAYESPGALGQTINLGTGSGVSIATLADMILRSLGMAKKIAVESERVRPENSEVMRLISDNKRALNLMSWRPTVELETGIAAVIEYMRENISAYKTAQYVV